MRKLVRSRVMLLVVVVALAFSTVRCGTIMYPERHSRNGQVDTQILVFDCLWILVAGVGVIFIIVDLLTGGMYEGGGHKRASLHPGDNVGFRLRGVAPAEANLEINLLPNDGKGQSKRLFTHSYTKGEEKKDITIFKIPSNLDPGSYRLAFKVNGVESSSWNLNVSR